MACSIGSVTCSYLRGRPPSATGGPFALRAVLIDTHANVETWIASLEALTVALQVWSRPGVNGWGLRTLDSRTGSTVTVTLDDGATFDNCVVGQDGERTPVRVARKQAAINAAGTSVYICEVDVLMFRYV